MTRIRAPVETHFLSSLRLSMWAIMWFEYEQADFGYAMTPTIV